MRRIFLLCLLGLMVIYCGCQMSMYTLTNNERKYPTTRAENVRVTTNEKIEGEYTELGYVFAGGGSVQGSIANLKEKAADMGGTAVIRLQTTVIRTFIVIIFIPIPVDNFYSQGIVVKS